MILIIHVLLKFYDKFFEIKVSLIQTRSDCKKTSLFSATQPCFSVKCATFLLQPQPCIGAFFAWNILRTTQFNAALHEISQITLKTGPNQEPINIPGKTEWKN